MFAVFMFLTFESLLLRCFDDSSACFCVHVWFYVCCVVPSYGCFFGVFCDLKACFLFCFKMSFSVCLAFCDMFETHQL